MGWFEDQMRRDEAIREARRRQTEEEVQSAFMRGFRPQLVKDAPATSAPSAPLFPECRGVELDDYAPVGYVRARVISAAGELLLETMAPERIANKPGFISNLHKFLDREDPQVQLRAI